MAGAKRLNALSKRDYGSVACWAQFDTVYMKFLLSDTASGLSVLTRIRSWLERKIAAVVIQVQ